MPPARAIVATPFAKDLESLQSAVKKMSDIRIVAHAPGLMELFSAVEADPPNIVIVSEELAQKPDFALLNPLFEALDVRWIRFSNGSPVGKSTPNDNVRRTGVFGLSLDQSTHAICRQLQGMLSGQRRPHTPPVSARPPVPQRYSRMVLIGASTGGVEALKTIISSFDASCPPTVVVQHTTPKFGTGLASVLAKASSARVQAFSPNTRIERGHVYVVAGQEHHIVLSGRQGVHLTVGDRVPMSGHRPSIDKLFLSAVPYAKQVAAAILTGMGEDGADGLLALRKAGAKTLAQDQKSSVVYGMPAVAWANGAAEKRVSIEKIASVLLADAAQ